MHIEIELLYYHNYNVIQNICNYFHYDKQKVTEPWSVFWQSLHVKYALPLQNTHKIN